MIPEKTTNSLKKTFTHLWRQISNFLRGNWLSLFFFFITGAVAIFIGSLGVCMLPIDKEESVKKDTIYIIEHFKDDSLLNSIANDMHEIKSMLKTQKTVHTPGSKTK